MQVNLKVIGGKNDGRQIGISVPEFIIGRGEQAHLRPSSDLVSRRHCSIKIENGSVTVRDLGSRNGTFVNGEALTGPHIAKLGDVVRIGRLQLEILIDHVVAGVKKPKVAGVADAAARTAISKAEEKDWTDESITDWLAQDPGETANSARSMNETRQFTLDDTKYKFAGDSEGDELPSNTPPVDDTTNEDVTAKTEESVSEGGSGLFKKKKKKAKLPDKPRFTSENTKDAAGDVLRKFFNQR